MATFGDLKTAAEMRDIFRKVARLEIDRTIPSDVFALVISVDTEERVAELKILHTDEIRPFEYGLGTPPSVGAKVRITGRAGSRYLLNGSLTTGSTGVVDPPPVVFNDPDPPTVSLVATGAGVREVGDLSVTSVLLSVTVEEGDDPITSARFYRNGTLLNTIPSPGTSFSYTDTTPVTSDVIYTVEVDSTPVDGTVISSTVTSNEEAFYFVYPYYYGLSATDALGSGVGALTQVIAREGQQTYVFTLEATAKYVYFAQPSTYDPLTLIRDRATGIEYWPNGFKAVDTATVGGVSYDIYQSEHALVSPGGAVYTLDFGPDDDATGSGVDLRTLSQIPARAGHDLLSVNGQEQIYELADKMGPLNKLYSMSSVIEEWDEFIGGRADSADFHTADDSRSGLIGDLGWLDLFVQPSGGSVSISPAQTIDANASGYLEFRVTKEGVSSNDMAIIYRNQKMMSLTPTFTNAWRVKMPSAVNDGVNEVKVRFGLHDADDSTLPDNGFWLEYGQETGASAGNWHFRTGDTGNLSDTDTGVEVDSEYHWFVITCDGAGDAATVRLFIVDDIVDWNPAFDAPVAMIFDPTTLPSAGDAYGPTMMVSKKKGAVLRTVRLSDYYLRLGMG